MKMFSQVKDLLKEKKELFLLYEQETAKMVSEELEDIDRIVSAVKVREELIDRINLADEQLGQIRASGPQGQHLYDVAKNRCDFGTLDEEERLLFLEGQEIYGIINRIKEAEATARVAMKKILESLQDKIRTSNTNTKFTGYLKQMDQGAKGVLYDQKR